MNRTRVMTNFHSRENARGAKTWARFYRYQLEDSAQLDLKKVADKVYGSHDVSATHRARIMILSLRKPLEKQTGKILSCFKGTYSLITPKTSGSVSAERLERNKRHLHTSSYFESYRRSVELSVRHNPSIINEARKQLHSLESVITKAERGIFKRAYQIVTRHNAKLQRGSSK